MAPKLKMTLKIETEDGATLIYLDRVDFENFIWHGKGGIIFEDQHCNLCLLNSLSLIPHVEIIGQA